MTGNSNHILNGPSLGLSANGGMYPANGINSIPTKYDKPPAFAEHLELWFWHTVIACKAGRFLDEQHFKTK